MLISVSDLKTHVTCPQLYDHTVRQRKARPGDAAPALVLGTLIHKALEAKLLRKPWRASIEQHELTLLRDYEPVLDLWEPPATWEVLGTETEVRLPLAPGIMGVGRVDGRIRWNGKVWPLQHKSLASTVPTHVFAEVQRTDWHECFYQAAIEAETGEKCGGTILNIIRKLSAGAIARNPGAAIELHYLTRSPEIIREALADMAIRALRIQEEGEGAPIEKTRSACGGMFRNYLCSFKPVCDGLESINGSGFITIEPRYVEEAA